MTTYIKLDLLTGKLKLITADKMPIPKANEIIYEPSLYSEKDGRVLKLSEIAEKYKQSQIYIEERDMGSYGSGIFTKSLVPENKLFLPYSGLYASITEKEKFTRNYMGSKYNFGDENFICWTNENLCFAHGVQHFSKKKYNSNACSANLFPELIYFKIKFDGKVICLPLFYFSNIRTLDSNNQLGWDYGIEYWVNVGSGYVEWDSKGDVVNNVALLGVKVKGEEFTITVSQNPETKIFYFSEPYMIVFPKGIKEELFSSVNLLGILPVLFIPEKLIKNIKEKSFIVISLATFLDEKILSEDKFPNYLFAKNKLYLGIDFLENLTSYELNKLFVTLNVTEIECSGFEQNLVSSNAKVSDALTPIFKALNITGNAVKDSETLSLESDTFSNAFDETWSARSAKSRNPR